MLLVAEKRIRRGICHAIMKYTDMQKKKKKKLKNYDKNKDSSHIQYLDANYLYGWAILRKWKLHKKYNEDGDRGFILEVDTEYPKNLYNLHDDLPLLPKVIKIKKCNKLVCNLYDKSNYVVP